MNLWHLFPESLLLINGIFQLPYLGIIFYLYVFYLVIKDTQNRRSLIVFLLLSILASMSMIVNVRSSMGNMIPPLLLLIVMGMPLLKLMISLYKRSFKNARKWLLVTLAGCFHSISWMVWFFVIASS